MKPFNTILIMCTAHIFSMAGFATYPALLPSLIPIWQLTNTQAGWISGIFFAGYVASVPVLVTLTDRFDSRLIYISGLVISTIGLLGFGFLANDFWSAMVWQAVQGAGIGGTYMTGLRVMTDREVGSTPSRAIAFYTAAFSAGTAFSFVISGNIGLLWGWQTAFYMAAIGPIIAIVSVLLLLSNQTPNKVYRHNTNLLDFRPVFSNREAFSYTLGYIGHSWELFALRGWIVTFLVFAGAQQGGAGILSAVVIAGIANIIGGPVSIIGNELAERFGRKKIIFIIMLFSGFVALATGISASFSLYVAAILVVIYSGFIMGDSSSLTAGATNAADPSYRGATLAVHSVLGFSGALLGPLAVGLVLDISGGRSSGFSWILAFVTIGFGSLGGAALIWLTKLKKVNVN